MGISTLNWTTDRDYWQEWYPADLVTESFPGQFRNWFYALITESTVMTGQAPFTTLFGYALLRDEHGEEMHKSKGNAIWFDEAAEQIGADVMRWMFSAANPAVNLNFGYHLAHEEVRRFFLPLWNTYGFFVTYARLDGWTPSDADGTDGPAAARTLLDRWILSRLEAVIGDVRGASTRYDAQRATRAIEAFVDELSNWYVRRNRRRFWKGELDDDKRAAYATLHGVLVDLTRLLAPFVPHLAEAMWQNLVTAGAAGGAGLGPPGRLPGGARGRPRRGAGGVGGAGAPGRGAGPHGARRVGSCGRASRWPPRASSCPASAGSALTRGCRGGRCPDRARSWTS